LDWGKRGDYSDEDCTNDAIDFYIHSLLGEEKDLPLTCEDHVDYWVFSQINFQLYDAVCGSKGDTKSLIEKLRDQSINSIEDDDYCNKKAFCKIPTPREMRD
jgi:hypothetical protein